MKEKEYIGRLYQSSGSEIGDLNLVEEEEEQEANILSCILELNCVNCLFVLFAASTKPNVNHTKADKRTHF